MRRGFLPAFILALLLGLFFALAPPILENSMNRISGDPLPKVSERARQLHASLDIVDLHSDSLLWKRDFDLASQRGHMDLPRLQEGHVALQILSSVTKTPAGQNYDANGSDSDNIRWLAIAQMQPLSTWNNLLQRSLFHADKLNFSIARSRDALRLIAAPVQIENLLAARDSAPDQPPIGVMLSIEGLQSLEGEIKNLDRLYGAGFRMAGLTHFFDNELSGSMHGLEKGGLTPFGRQVVQRMENIGMIVDIAHLSPAGVTDVLEMARRPIVSSHGGVQATCAANRNLNDEQIRAIAANGGLIGIGYWDGAVCDPSPASIVRAMRHVRDLVGIDHVALGSDFDGAVTTSFDTSNLVQLTQAMIDANFTENEIHAVMGKNALRLLRDGLKPFAHSSASRSATKPTGPNL